MRAAVYLARRRLTREWHALIPVCLLTAFAGALALGALVGGLRTASALDRMEAATKPYDVWVEPMSVALDPFTLNQIKALPMVKSLTGVEHHALGAPGGFANIHQLRWNDLDLLIRDGDAFSEFARPVVSSGRLPSIESTNEVFVQQMYADAHDLHVGDLVPVRTFSPEESTSLWMTADADVRALTADPLFGTPRLLKIAGIGSTQDSLVAYGGTAPIPFIGGPGLKTLFSQDGGGLSDSVLVQLTDPSELQAFEDHLAKMFPDQVMTYQTWSSTKALSERAIRPVAVVLWLFAATLAAIGLILVGHALARCFTLDVPLNRTLAAMGFTHTQRALTVFLVMIPPIFVGGVLAMAGAFATSYATPLGPARAAEVSPGFRFDGVFVSGATLWCAAIFLMSLLPVWRSTRTTSHGRRSEGSGLAARLSAWGVPYPIPLGIRFAFEPGRSSDAVPTRSTLTGAVLGGLVSTLVLTFVASLDGAISQPDRYGVNFDGAVLYTYHSWGSSWPPLDDLERPLRTDPGVAEIGMLRIDEVSVGSVPTMALAFSGPADLGPTMVQGRMPAAADEVALGTVTVRELNTSVGGHVKVKSPGFTGDARVVGVVVLPSQGYFTTSDQTAPGVGAVVDADALGTFDPNSVWLAIFRTKSGVPASQVNKRVEGAAVFPFEALGQDFVWPQEVQTLRELRTLPLALGAVVLAIMAGMGVFGLSFAIRGRRRDVTILRILGLRRGGLRLIGATHGATIVVFGALIGVPLGLAIGRWSWTWLATQFGLSATPETNLGAVMWLALAEVTLAAVSGAFAVAAASRRMADVVPRNV